MANLLLFLIHSSLMVSFGLHNKILLVRSFIVFHCHVPKPSLGA